MAYFYQHLKGLTSNGTKWWINCEKIDANSGMKTPEIKYIKNTQGSTEQDLGNIITSNMSDGIINNAFTFKDTVNFNSGSTFKGYIGYKNYKNDGIETLNGLIIKGGNANNNAAALTLTNTQVKFEGVGSGDSGTRIQFISPSVKYSSTMYNNPIWFGLRSGDDYSHGFAVASFTESGTTYTSSNDIANTKFLLNIPLVTNGQYIKVKKSTSSSTDGYIVVENYITAGGYITADSYIQASYFNATSDKRAKTGIIQSTFSALNIIKSLPIYNFKYKSDNSDSIGIIAQEALKVHAGDFNLVVNPQASGENGNYMSVKESKLVYIAWKAIQEQQEIIDKQSKEIEELKQLVKTLIEK